MYCEIAKYEFCVAVVEATRTVAIVFPQIGITKRCDDSFAILSDIT